MPKMFPNGSTTDAVINPSLRSVIGANSFAPIDRSLSSVICKLSTCQKTTTPVGLIDIFSGANLTIDNS